MFWWMKLLQNLQTFNRVSTLKRLVDNCESIKINVDHWNRTSAAVLGLYGENSETVKTVVEQMSKFAGASVQVVF